MILDRSISMEHSEKNLAEESKKIQKLREKLRQQLGSIEQKVVERTLKNKNIKVQENRVAK